MRGLRWENKSLNKNHIETLPDQDVRELQIIWEPLKHFRKEFQLYKSYVRKSPLAQL